MFAAAQLEKACRVLEAMVAPVTLRLDPGAGAEDKFSQALCRAVDQLALASGDKIQVIRQQFARDGRPLLEVANVRYRAVPFGPELDPFLDLLVWMSEREGDGRRRATADHDTHETLDPAALQVMMAPTCPNCPRTVAACNRVAASHPAVALDVVDVQYFRDLAGAIKSVPTLIIDGAHTVVGVIGVAELLELLGQRSRRDYARRALASMIQAGRFADAQPLLASVRGQEAFAALLAAGTMYERIGLLLAAEEALAADPHALDEAVPLLLPLLTAEEDNLRGDTADLLGRIGAPGARDCLKELLSDGNPDVRDAAQDALEQLRDPS